MTLLKPEVLRMETWIAVLVIFLVVAGFGSYIFLMIFYPEWVGITGKAARKTLDEHREGSKVDDSDIM